MCGIIGSIGVDLTSQYKTNFQNIIKTLHHRGPDASGIKFFEDRKVALGHSRLSIIDTTSISNQPMTDVSGKISITYNGEIFNYLEIRNELIDLGAEFVTESDTEVIIQLYIVYGEDSFKMLDGQFAFCITDLQRNCSYLVRDRCGEKPFFLFNQDRSLSFCSEIKPLMLLSNCSKEIDNSSLKFFLKFGYCKPGSTLIKNISQLKPGSFLKIDLVSLRQTHKFFWNISSIKINQEITYEDAKRMTMQALSESVRKRLRADVPVGIFLSGGLDSSIVSVIAARHTNKLDTYSVSFPGSKSNDESKFSNLVADSLSSNHETIIADNIEIDEVDQILSRFDSPIFDSSIIPTFQICKYVRSKAKVFLGGDGGDELFGGYSNYRNLLKISPFYMIPSYLRQTAGNLYLSKFNFTRYRNWVDAVSSGKQFSAIKSKQFFDNQISEQQFKFDFVNEISISDELDVINQSSIFDFNNFLSEDILLKTDRASMLNSIELRSPFLSNDLVELAFSLPNKFKIDKHSSKRVLKSAFKDLLPKDFSFNRKQGFAAPMQTMIMQKGWKEYFLEYFNMQSFLKEEFASELIKNDQSISANAEKIFGIAFLCKWIEDNNLSINEKG